MTEPALRLDLLHAIRLRGLIQTAELSRLVDHDPVGVVEVLESERTSGTVVFHQGRLTGWSLTERGRSDEESMLRVELDSTGQRQVLAGLYGEFLPLNAEVLLVCTSWQVVRVSGSEVLNDHSDPEYDQEVLRQLSVLHESAVRLTTRMAAASHRFGGYSQRLSTARERVVAGETEWLTRSTIDSYHSVWFELHENLLAMLGKRRSQERHS